MWIGANNWQLDDGTTAYLPSNGALAPFLVTDEADANTQNCVTLLGSVDYNCHCSQFKFMCEVRAEDPPEPPCRPDLSRKWVGVTDICALDYEPPQCPAECIEEECQCQTDSVVGNTAIKVNGKVIDIIRSECLNWVEAQQYCCSLDQFFDSGRLFEPANSAEWVAVATILRDVSLVYFC